MEYVIRPLTAEDESVLWEMLFQALHTSETAPPPETAHQPEFARYVEGWGRGGDAGFVAQDRQSGQVLGAVWTRKFGDEPDAMPNLAFSVKSGHRRQGIGAALLTQLVKANPAQSRISIRAAANNPVVRLYERFGFKITEETPHAITMERRA